jgi:hypothetical protein
MSCCAQLIKKIVFTFVTPLAIALATHGTTQNITIMAKPPKCSAILITSS